MTNTNNTADDPKVQAYMAEVQAFISAVENTSINLEFDPHNDEEIHQCITNMTLVIDSKAASFKHNQTVAEKAQEIKTYFKQQILANADSARNHTKKRFH